VLAYTPRHPDLYAVPAALSKPISSSSLPVDTEVVQRANVRVGLTDKLVASLHTGTSCSIQQLGGIKCFLFLYAKVCYILFIVFIYLFFPYIGTAHVGTVCYVTITASEATCITSL